MSPHDTSVINGAEHPFGPMGTGWILPSGPPLPPEMIRALADEGRARSASTFTAFSELRDRAQAVLDRARNPLTAADLAERAHISSSAALAMLRDWATAGHVTALPRSGSPAPYLDRYATPAQLTAASSLTEEPMPAAPALAPPADPGTETEIHPVPTPERFRVLVTGSRTWTRTRTITDALDRVRLNHPEGITLVHGACPSGADAIAAAWAEDHLGIPAGSVLPEPHPADWGREGKRAGMTRNTRMTGLGAGVCLAFIRDGSPGATHCAIEASRAGIPVVRHLHDTRTATTTTATQEADLGGQMLAAALAYAARGWHVFPLRPGDKRPAFPNHPADRCQRSDPRCRAAGRHVGWEERATTDPDRIERAWNPTHLTGRAGRAPFGIGIACGPSGLVVIDADTPKPRPGDPRGKPAGPPKEWALPGVVDGLDVIDLLAERANQRYPDGDTHEVDTPSGGRHWYWAAPALDGGLRFRNTAGHLGWLVDSRAWGGYVAAPPTTINRPDGTTGTYTVAVDAPAAALPAWLAKALTPAPLPAQKPEAAVLRATGDARRDAYLAAAVTGQLDAITTAGDGRRNRALYLSATALGQLVSGGELEPDAVADWLESAALAAGLSPAETARTIRSGMKAGANRPRTLTTAPSIQEAAA